jgi:hypothetical protein
MIRSSAVATLIQVACFALFTGSEALGAGRPYAYTQGAEGLPETGLEVESWFSVETPRDSTIGPTLDWWFGPVVGVTDQLEVALYGVFVQPPAGDHVGSSLGLGALRLQASYLLAPAGAWPIDVRIRAEFERPLGMGHDDRTSPNTWLTAIASFDGGPVNVTANAGGVVEFEGEGPSPWIIYSLASSIDVVGGLRIGVEEFGEYKVKDKQLENVLGPTLGFGISRVWTATTLGFGLGPDSPRYQARIIFGLSF